MRRECKDWPLRAQKEVRNLLRMLRAPTLAAAEGRLAAPVEVPAAAPVKGNLRDQKTAAGNVLLLLLLLLLRLRLPILQGLPQRWGATRSIKSQGSALILRLLRLQGLPHNAIWQEAAETATTPAAGGEGDLSRVTRPCLSNWLWAPT